LQKAKIALFTASDYLLSSYLLGKAASATPSLGLVLPLSSGVERNRFAVVSFSSANPTY
jgi:hypothetical protein